MADMRIPSGPTVQVSGFRPMNGASVRPRQMQYSFVYRSFIETKTPGRAEMAGARPQGFEATANRAVLREIRLEPGIYPKLHLTISHPVHVEVQITLTRLPSGVQIEVRCPRPERLARVWPRMGRRHRVCFVKTCSGDPAGTFCRP